MASYLYPGVYIEELSGGARPIESVGTSTAAFIGFTDRRPAGNNGEPLLVTSWTQYSQSFGEFAYGFYTPLAVYGFFQNGGGACYIQSMLTGDMLTKNGGVEIKDAAGKTPVLKVISLSSKNLKITIQPSDAPPADQGAKTKPAAGAKKAAGGEGAAADGDDKPQAADANGAAGAASQTFDLEVFDADSGRAEPLERYTRLSLDPAAPKNAIRTVNTKSAYIRLELADPTVDLKHLAPQAIKGAALDPKNALVAQKAATPDLKEPLAPVKGGLQFDGKTEERTGFQGLTAIEDVSIVCAPDIMFARQQDWITDEIALAAQQALIKHCEIMRDRIAILDTPPGLNVQQVRDWRLGTANFSSDGGFATLYYPWVKVNSPLGKSLIAIPPSGHVAGLYARVDTERGVHKAPANEVLRGVVELEYRVSDIEQGTINMEGVNCIRSFQGRGIRVWGARTLADAASEWKYVPVRRLFCMVEESIQRGTQWAVFEPNNLDLWERLKRDIRAYLTNVWRAGALFGLTDAEAFFVKCDEELNPKEVRDAGQVIIHVGIAPVKPAEFVIIRIQQTS